MYAIFCSARLKTCPHFPKTFFKKALSLSKYNILFYDPATIGFSPVLAINYIAGILYPLINAIYW